MAKASIRAAIRIVVEPWLAEQGFCGEYPEFHRLADGKFQGLAVRKDKYGSSFWFEVGAKPFSAIRYNRLQLTDPANAILPRLHELDFEQREQIHPTVSPPHLNVKSEDGLPLFGESQQTGGNENSAAMLEVAASSCLGRIEAWFSARVESSG